MIAGLVAVLSFFTGFALSKLSYKNVAKAAAWLLSITSVALVYFSSAGLAPGLSMLVLISILFLGMKAVSIVYRYPAKSRLNFLQWTCFALGWPGMDAIPFEKLGDTKVPNNHLRSGVVFFIVGSVLLFLLAYSLQFYEPPVYLLCLISFIPFVMIFHLGLFNIIAAFWATVGVSVVPLMDAPWKASSLSDFWGKRWNIAFIQMTRIVIFLPLAKHASAGTGLLVAFIVSGIFHEVALTLPVAAGFGLPLLYFLIQVILIKIEKLFLKKSNRVLKTIWTFSCLLLPFPLLFHAAFVKAVFLPFLHELL